jgi:hypothetical protein
VNFQSTAPRLRVALLASLFLIFAAAAGSPAYGQATTTTTNEDVPVTNSLPNPCNGDVVTLQGTAHVVNSVTTDSSGGMHVKTHINYQDVSGTGVPSGVNYRVGTTSNETLNDSDGPQTETTVIQTIKLISQGSVLNSFLHVVIHITINANGQTTSTVSETRIECRGRG